MKALSYLKHKLPTPPTFKKHHAEPSAEQIATAATKIASLDHVLKNSTKNSSILTKKGQNDQGQYLEYLAVQSGPKQIIRLNGLLKYLKNIQRTEKDIRTTARQLQSHPDAGVRASADSLLKHCKKHHGPLLHTATLRDKVSDLKAKLDVAKAEEEWNALDNENPSSREHPTWETYFDRIDQSEAEAVQIDPDLMKNVPADPQSHQPSIQPVIQDAKSVSPFDVAPRTTDGIVQETRDAVGAKFDESVEHNAVERAGVVAGGDPDFKAIKAVELPYDEISAFAMYNYLIALSSTEPNASLGCGFESMAGAMQVRVSRVEADDKARTERMEFARVVLNYGIRFRRAEDPQVAKAGQALFERARAVIDAQALTGIVNDQDLRDAFAAITSKPSKDADAGRYFVPKAEPLPWFTDKRPIELYGQYDAARRPFNHETARAMYEYLKFLDHDGNGRLPLICGQDIAFEGQPLQVDLSVAGSRPGHVPKDQVLRTAFAKFLDRFGRAYEDDDNADLAVAGQTLRHLAAPVITGEKPHLTLGTPLLKDCFRIIALHGKPIGPSH